jgi:hypothetical protein
MKAIAASLLILASVVTIHFANGASSPDRPAGVDAQNWIPVLRPGLLIYVLMTSGAVPDPTVALRRRTAAEMRVMIRPTGKGSMKV